MNTVITLTTDFGIRNGFVGAMKGVILCINPEALIVDITHEVDAQNVFSAAFTLKNSCRFFPRGTIHVAVVDPGVGGPRKALLVQTDTYFFVGPDNGLFSFVSKGEDTLRIRELAEKKYFLNPVSDTFHGRDIFAPVAAYLSLGIDPGEFGPEVEDCVTLSFPQPMASESGIAGQILSSDRFGNLITNIDRGLFEDTVEGRGVRITFGSYALQNVSHSYSEVKEGSPLAIFGSSGFLELSVRMGNAREQLGLKHGDPVRVRVD